MAVTMTTDGIRQLQEKAQLEEVQAALELVEFVPEDESREFNLGFLSGVQTYIQELLRNAPGLDIGGMLADAVPQGAHQSRMGFLSAAQVCVRVCEDHPVTESMEMLAAMSIKMALLIPLLDLPAGTFRMSGDLTILQ